MWIRSQDRLRLLNLNGFNYLNENNKHKILGFDTSSDNDDMYWLLGKYSTKEKGIKVLDKACKELTKMCEQTKCKDCHFVKEQTNCLNDCPIKVNLTYLDWKEWCMKDE